MQPKMIVEGLIVIGVTVLVTFIVVKWVSRVLYKSAEKWELDLTVIHVLNDIIKYTLYVLAAALILKWFGIDLTGLILSIGIVGVAVGFAARDTLANFISGLFILADKSFKVGDVIEVSNKKGTVIKMGFRTTTICTSDNKIITIPNSSFSKNPYVNYTASHKRRIDLKVNIPMEADIKEFEGKIKDTIKKIDGILTEPEPGLIILEIADTGMIAKVTAWTDKTDKVAHYRSLIGENIKKLINR
ncbi:MAG TPA: mechanosensitive ion channel family protein [Methanothermobacter sp.]|mgnify:CR=1 FL=1|jgi:small conductance mechanosensitive channel|uniref:Mechanosensitive ion channel protein MscS n=1 Tax=Methanothermobacter tenebrarum TaxID=680118 RepID=A0ABN6PGC6_9EURY|nr:mechanosensitive ion channel family protein [Methanothermobacter tenebrarum]MDD3454343.1 mechanosensitive ion channel family protein [Methanobacteriales archaeon]MDX9693344.1 mechanosensitive ion channel family protein [Methanothermobacter sp.]BDH79891.1 mechanosensitive ion channel protein MscS [Methanothermobacter tenebrarum]HHW16792.1 mechanosensitive ion channel family protein [Methanothermobacter sp.]HPU37737.1 mechanosensitive ion channel family protein [Methanothermobacter sp.]